MKLGMFRNGATAPRLARVRRAHVESLELRTLFSAGDLDTSWGNAGHAFADFGNTSDLANGVATQTLGSTTRIVTVGAADTGDFEFYSALSRHNADGSVDTSFNGGQPVLTRFGGTVSFGTAVAVDNQQRIIVLGHGTAVGPGGFGQDALGVARYLSNGTLDTNFGTGGTILLGNLTDPLTNEVIDSYSELSLAIDANNRVVISATGGSGGGTNMYVVRLTESGFADGSFGLSGGVARTDVGANDYAGGLAIDAAGNIYQAGFTATGTNDTGNFVGNLVTVRYSANGSTGIAGYGNGGLYDGAAIAMDGVRSAFLDGDGTFVIGGVVRVSNPGGFDDNVFELARVSADGHAAVSSVTSLINVDSAYSMAPQRDGKIVVVGDDYNADFGPTHYTVSRYNADLSLDESFVGNDATPGDHVYTSPVFSIVQGVVMDATDGIIVAATASNAATASDDFFLSRHDSGIDSSGGGSGDIVGTASAGGIDKPDDPDVHHYYSVAEGHTITLHGSGSAVLQGGSGLNGYLANQHRVLGGTAGGEEQQDVVFSWLYNGVTIPGADLDVTGVDDGTVQATFQVALASNPAVVIASSVATVEVTNVAPHNAAINAPVAPKEGQSITLSGSAVDVPADGLFYSWTVTQGAQTLTGSGPTFNFTPADNGAYTVNLRVEDDDHGVDNVQLTLNVENAAPEVSLGGIPTQTDEGTALTFSSEVDDVDADANPTYLWTVKRGTTTLATGGTPNFAFTPNDNGSYQVSLTVTDKDGGATTESQTFTVNNVAPTATVSGDTTGVRGQTRTLNLGATDPGAADVLAGFTFTVDWADGSPIETIPAGTTTATHVYMQNGVYQAVVTATDHDNATSTPLTVTMTTLTAVLQNGVLTVAAPTNSSGVVSVRRSGSSTAVTVVGGGATENQTFSGASRIVINGGSAADVISLSGVNVPVEVYGGAGDDVITGGSAADILVGGAGNDVITGGDGRDILIGGLGADVLTGSNDDDILVAGYTSHDANPLALRAISNEWQSSRTYEQRVSNIRGPVTNGVNGSAFFRDGYSVWDDGSRDIVSGNAGRDWFIADEDGAIGGRDITGGAAGNEVVTDVDVQP